MGVWFLIPALNEESTVAPVARLALQSGLGRVLVVSDGSSDGTAERAREAGAEVLELRENLGRGGACAAALEHLREGEVIVMLDADLVGLLPEHLVHLADPVLRGEADMVVGRFVGGRWRTDWAQWITPYLSGQRALRRSLLASVPDLAARRYDLELALTRHARRQGAKVRYIGLPGLTQVMKEEKRGFWVGLGERLAMYWQIVRYAFRR